MSDAVAAEQSKTHTAIFAGGCFWCTEAEFDTQKGVLETTSGYIGGESHMATYEAVSSGKSGHYEALKVTYDPKIVSYEQLLEIFWSNIDPTDSSGQFADRGSQYLTAIFYNSDEQKKLAQKSLQEKREFLKRKQLEIVTEILPAQKFYVAEEYHQDYYKKNPIRYNAYKYGSGRPSKLQEIWTE